MRDGQEWVVAGGNGQPQAATGRHGQPRAAIGSNNTLLCFRFKKRVFLMAQKVFLGLSSAKVSKTAIPVCDKTLLVCTYTHTHICIYTLTYMCVWGNVRWVRMGNYNSNGQPQTAVDSHGQPQAAMGSHGQSWAATGSHGQSWTVMASHRHPWAVMGSHRQPLAVIIHCCVSDSKRVFLMAQKVFLGLSSLA